MGYVVSIFEPSSKLPVKLLTSHAVGRLDYRHKKVGVIGIGSSAIQIIPSLQRLDGVKLSVFMRSKTWIAPSFGNEAMASMGFQETTTECNQTS